jgi:hypothetical protein
MRNIRKSLNVGGRVDIWLSLRTDRHNVSTEHKSDHTHGMPAIERSQSGETAQAIGQKRDAILPRKQTLEIGERTQVAQITTCAIT